MTPGSNEYIIGSPLVKSATIHLENGKKFKVSAPKNSEKRKYIQEVLLNGKQHHKTFIKHEDIMNGGSLTFDMRVGRKSTFLNSRKRENKRRRS